MKYYYLSYPISEGMPVYGGIAHVRVDRVKSIQNGDSSNVFCFALENHWGTHVDCPAHYFLGGNTIIDYTADFWVFTKPQIISLEVEQGQIISSKDLPADINADTDLVMLKSGWGKFRGNEIYYLNNPGFDPEFGLYIREHCPSVRAIGFDWVSLSSFAHRNTGREAHRNFLNPLLENHPIVIIEDMCLPDELEELSMVHVLPIRIQGIDSAPCTVIGTGQ